MDVWIVRHAIAADRAPHSNSDFDRPLTEEGRVRFRTLTDLLARQVKHPDAILTSPLVRTVETAEILAHSVDIKKKEIVTADVLAPGVDIRRLIQTLAGHSAETIALVGHEPDMGRCASAFVGGGRFSFGKGHIACIRFHGTPEAGAGELCWFVSPKLAPPE